MSTARDASRSVIENLEPRCHLAIDTGVMPLAYGGPGFDNAQRVVTTSDGLITTGLFSGTVDFDPTSAVNTLTAQGDSDAYIARYNSNGSLRWALRMGGNHTEKDFEDFEDRSPPINAERLGSYVGKVGELPAEAGEYVYDLAVNAAGDIYISGAFRQTITVGNVTLTANRDFNEDYYDAVVIKINGSNGTVDWTRQIGGRFDDVALSLGLDAGGNVFVGGYFTREAVFDRNFKISLNDDQGRDAGYVMRLSPNNVLSWVYHFTSEATSSNLRQSVNDIAVTASGNVYFVGTFADEADFDPSRRQYKIEADDDTDAYLGYLNRKGQFQWALATGGEEADGNVSVAIGPDGGVYTAGYFSDEVDVDPRRNVTRIFKATPEDPGDDPDYSDLLISRFEANGQPVWQAQIGGGYLETIADMQIGADGSIYTIGSFYNEADFAPGPSEVILSSALTDDGSIKDRNSDGGRNESYDWFVSRLSPRGKYINATRIGGADDDFASGIFVDGNQLYVSGRAVSTRQPDRDDRDETALILLLDDDLTRVA